MCKGGGDAPVEDRAFGQIGGWKEHSTGAQEILVFVLVLPQMCYVN